MVIGILSVACIILALGLWHYYATNYNNWLELQKYKTYSEKLKKENVYLTSINEFYRKRSEGNESKEDNAA
jgi:hypothetical protein